MKKLALVLALVMSLAVFTACGNNEDTTTEEDTTVETTEETPAEGEETEENETTVEETTVEETTEETTLEDGTYTGTAAGFGGDIEVDVTVVDGAIESVEVISHEESVDDIEEVATAIEEVPAAIVEANSTDVDTVAGATMTSEGIINAVNNALEN